MPRAPWSKVEDAALFQVIKEKGTKQWNDIAVAVNQRTGSPIFRNARQCYKRWVRHLDPTKKRGDWTEEEEINLLKLFLEKGRKWSIIAKKFGNRTGTALRDRWRNMLRTFKRKNKIESPPEGSSEETERAWERKCAAMLLEAKRNGLWTGLPYSSNL